MTINLELWHLIAGSGVLGVVVLAGVRVLFLEPVVQHAIEAHEGKARTAAARDEYVRAVIELHESTAVYAERQRKVAEDVIADQLARDNAPIRLRLAQHIEDSMNVLTTRVETMSAHVAEMREGYSEMREGHSEIRGALVAITDAIRERTAAPPRPIHRGTTPAHGVSLRAEPKR